jgi:hypothetical protein
MCNQPYWAIAFHSDGSGRGSRRWYRISRIIYADNRCFELYWHPDIKLRGNNLTAVRKAALLSGLKLLAKLYVRMPNGSAGEMIEISK